MKYSHTQMYCKYRAAGLTLHDFIQDLDKRCWNPQETHQLYWSISIGHRQVYEITESCDINAPVLLTIVQG